MRSKGTFTLVTDDPAYAVDMVQELRLAKAEGDASWSVVNTVAVAVAVAVISSVFLSSIHQADSPAQHFELLAIFFVVFMFALPTANLCPPLRTGPH